MQAVAKRLIPRKLWQRLHAWKILRSIATFQPRNVRHIYGQFPLTVHLADPLGCGWYDHDWVEPGEFAILRAGRLRQGARVFDLGAHQGIVALMLSRIVGPTGSVIAVEALPHNAAVARTNRELNGAEGLTIVNAAVADASGSIEVTQGLNGQVCSALYSAGLIRVPAVTIDSLAAEHGTPDVLYLDVEGYECHALRGASETLKHRPDAFVEVHVGHGLEIFGGSVDEVLSHFLAEHYELFMGSDDVTVFVPFCRDSPILAGRFFLAARARAVPA